MQRRTFLQGAAASMAAAPFAPALGQGYKPPPQSELDVTTIYLPPEYADYAEQLNRGRFKPLHTKSESLLPRYGLPIPPDRSSPLYEIWERIFGGRLLYAPAPAIAVTPDNQTNPLFRQAPQSLVTTRYETSPNWSGAYIKPNNGNMFTEVAGVWQVPDITQPGGSSANTEFASSVWVGLDGQRRYFNSSLPQIGTRQEFDANGKAIYWAWWQWWVQGQVPVPPPAINYLAGNDTVFCQIQVLSPTQVNLSMAKMNNPKWSWNNRVEQAPMSPITNTQPQISGATAEWVVERPTMLFSDTLQALPNYGRVNFTTCVAAAQPAPPYSANAISQNLDGARFIQMYERLDNPSRARMLSKPSRPNPNQRDAFQVTYIGP